MATKKTNKLPEGVGKRIIETLKNQEYQLEEEQTSSTEPEIEEDEEGIEAEPDQVVEEIGPKDEVEEKNEVEIISEVEEEVISREKPEMDFEYAPKKTSKKKTEKRSYYKEESSEKPESSDIDTLLSLINHLPSGVTKQTGALIIRQTMEAMGISMNKVLADAQSVQEELEQSIKNNINVIEEYRTKVKILEQEIQKFRKKAHELEDIISLFILSDDKK